MSIQTLPPPFRPRQVERGGWWRRNRWWLLALPVAVLLFALGSSSRFGVWWSAAPHDRVAAGEQGERVHVTIPGVPEDDQPERDFHVTLTGTEYDVPYTTDSTFDEPLPPPDGVRTVAVHLAFEAPDPEPLQHCTVALYDTDGHRYEVDDASGSLLYQCVHPDLYDWGTGETAPTTGEWTAAPVFLVPDDAELAEVRVYWALALPAYVGLELPR